MEKIKGYLVDTEAGTAGIVELDKNLDAYYEALHCDTIDITTVRIGGQDFDVICDDNGLLCEEPVISAYGSDDRGFLPYPRLVGSLFVCRFNGVDDVTSIGDGDEELLKNATRLSIRKKERHMVLMLDD